MKFSKKKEVLIILALSVIGTLGMFLYENVFVNSETVVSRNAYGEGAKTEEYKLTIKDKSKSKDIVIDVEERAYTREEIQTIFQEMMRKLDETILGKNESLDHVEHDLNLVTELENYPVQIQWELDSYEIMTMDGKIRGENLAKGGTLLELRAVLVYGEDKAIYVRNAMIFPVTREGVDKLLYEIQQEIKKLEEETREKASFSLPREVSGVRLEWARKKSNYWYYILLIGVVLAVFVVYREREKIKQQEKVRRDALVRMYPGMISKFTMLISTGTTVKHAWERIVQNYEEQKQQIGRQVVYEEMSITLREIKGGISEGEAYERFGKRCGITTYVKFGVMLSQNLRKGSKGISDSLRMEAIQSFENRKSIAKRLGEEAGSKLLMPMMGMLAVVLIMVMVPAFLSMQL